MTAPRLNPFSDPQQRFDRLMASLEASYGDRMRTPAPTRRVFEIGTGKHRTQVVHVQLQHPADPPEARILAFSLVGRVPHRVDHQALLRLNAALDAGAVCIQDFLDADGRPVPHLVLRATHLLHTADADEVWEMVDQVARTADTLERELFGHDLQ